MNLSTEDKQLRDDIIKSFQDMVPEDARAVLVEQTRGFFKETGLPYTQNTLNTLIEGIRFYIALSSASEMASKFFLVSLMQQVQELEKNAPASPTL